MSVFQDSFHPKNFYAHCFCVFEETPGFCVKKFMIAGTFLPSLFWSRKCKFRKRLITFLYSSVSVNELFDQAVKQNATNRNVAMPKSVLCATVFCVTSQCFRDTRRQTFNPSLLLLVLKESFVTVLLSSLYW